MDAATATPQAGSDRDGGYIPDYILGRMVARLATNYLARHDDDHHRAGDAADAASA